MVVITHEMKVIERICDKVAVLDRSHVAEEGKVSEVFTNPRSEIGRELILSGEQEMSGDGKGRRLRLTFDSESSQAPILSSMILACQTPVNILFADTRKLGGAVYGQMTIELPDDEREAGKIIEWLKNSPVKWREEV